MDSDGHPPHYLLEEAREADWTDEQLLEALGEVALNEFQSSSPTPPASPRIRSTHPSSPPPPDGAGHGAGSSRLRQNAGSRKRSASSVGPASLNPSRAPRRRIEGPRILL